MCRQWQLPKRSFPRVKQLEGAKGAGSEKPETEAAVEMCSAAEALEIGHKSRAPPRMAAERMGETTLRMFDSLRWWGDGLSLACQPGLQQPSYG